MLQFYRTVSGNSRGKRILWIVCIRPRLNQLNSSIVSYWCRSNWRRLLCVLARVRACQESGITHHPNDRHNVINFVSGDWARSGVVGSQGPADAGGREQRSSISGRGHAGAPGWSSLPPPALPRRSVIARHEISIRRPNAARFTAGTCGN